MGLLIFNKTKNTPLSRNACVAATFFARLIGLLGRNSLGSEEAMIFHGVSSIHMYFMKFPIDVVFLDKNLKILKICHSLAPWQTASCFWAKTTIELPAGKCLEKSTQTGDIIQILSS